MQYKPVVEEKQRAFAISGAGRREFSGKVTISARSGGFGRLVRVNASQDLVEMGFDGFVAEAGTGAQFVVIQHQ
jgi:hypothetical protein